MRIKCSHGGMLSSLRIDTGEQDVFCIATDNQEAQGLLTGHINKVKRWNKSATLTHTINLPVRGEVTCICATPTKLAISVNTSIILYDPKQLSNKPIEVCSYNKDEINQLTIGSSGNYLLSCDDAGEIVVMNISIPGRSKLYKTCRYHSICSTVAFHPHRHWEMVSGGLDCHMVLWEYSRGHPLAILNTQECLPQDSHTYIVNPPMIHSLCTLGSKPLVAAGLGNGSVGLFHIGNRKIQLLSITQRHSNSVGSVTSFNTTRSIEIGGVGTCNDVIVTGGNDGKIIWSPVTRTLQDRKDNSRPSPIYNIAMEPLAVQEHGSKVNWIAEIAGWSNEDSSHVVGVVDQTSIVTLYTIKL